MISDEGGWCVRGFQVPYDEAIDVVAYVFSGSDNIATSGCKFDIIRFVVGIESNAEGAWTGCPVAIDGNCSTDEQLRLSSGESRNGTRKVRQRESEATEKPLPDGRVP